MKRTISAMRGPGSLNHNRRSFTAENVDLERSSLNVVYRDEPIQKVYHELFDAAVNRYNVKQKRKDRCITDYYEHLRTGKQEKLFHELIVQIGNKDDMGGLTENGALAKELLDEYMQGFQERNPTLRVFGAFLHMDEATPHLHIDFVPYVSGWKGKGLDTKVSLKQALKALGFAGGSKRESELNQWINAEKEQLAAVMERHGIEWEQKGTHEEHLSVLDFKKQERSKEVAALEVAKQECQTDLTEMQEQLETVQTAVDAAEQRVQKAELTYQKQSQKLNKLAPIMEGLENLSAQYSQRPEEWVPEAATFETAKSYREKKAMPLIQKLVKLLFALHRKYWEVKNERDKYQNFYQDEKKAANHLSQQLEQVKAENSQLYAMKRDFRRVWNYFGAEKMRKPVTSGKREAGKHPYYGASGIVDYVKDYIFDGDYLLVSKDGANLLARSTPIAFSISGKNWVNSDNPELYSQALTTCRRLFEGTAKELFDKYFPDYKDKKYITKSGKEIDVSGEHYKNKLSAVIERLEDKNPSKSMVGSNVIYLLDWMDNLTDLQCKGVHHEVTRQDATRCIIQTYICLGDILSLQDE